MTYYGIMCCTLTGDLDNLETECEWKPKHETCGFSFAKWFETEKERDKTKAYLKKTITTIQEKRK